MRLPSRLVDWIIKRYAPESLWLAEIYESKAYRQAIRYVIEAEKTKSLGVHKREYVQAHLMAWYQKHSIKKPREHFVNFLIELALWRADQ